MTGIPERVAVGKDFLNGMFPGWKDYINTDTLKMSSGRCCVLGQLSEKRSELDLPEWANGYAGMRGFLGKSEAWAVKAGFNSACECCGVDCEACEADYAALREEWLRVIREEA